MSQDALGPPCEVGGCLREPTSGRNGVLLVDEPVFGVPVQRMGAHLNDAEQAPRDKGRVPAGDRLAGDHVCR